VREHVDRAARRTAVWKSLIESGGHLRDIQRILGQQLDRGPDVALDGLRRLPEEGVGHALATRHAVAFLKLTRTTFFVVCVARLMANGTAR
jgi:hypothetical protein